MKDKFPEKIFYVCTGSKCKKKNSKLLAKHFSMLIKNQGMKGRMQVIRTACTGRCKFAPNICVQPDNEWFCMVKPEEAEKIFNKTVVRHKA